MLVMDAEPLHAWHLADLLSGQPAALIVRFSFANPTPNDKFRFDHQLSSETSTAGMKHSEVRAVWGLVSGVISLCCWHAIHS